MNGLKLENWKYSPLRLLPDGFEAMPSALKTESSDFVVKNGEHTKLVTIHEAPSSFKSTVLNIEVAQNASLQHWHLFDEGASAVHVEQMTVKIAGGGRYTLNALNIGSQWSRSDLHVQLLAEGAQCELIGLDLGNGNSHIDRHLLIEHLAPHTQSSQLFKGIFDDDASASFYGKVKVHRGADGTSAKQVNRNLLLSPNATINTRPQLEIDTDDVACTHGATVGQLDENAVFFLRSRGLSEDAARTLLTEAFAREILNAFQMGVERDDMERRVFAWLAKEKR